MQRGRRLQAVAGLLAMSLLVASGLVHADDPSTTDPVAMGSYALGRSVGLLILEEGYELDDAMLFQGIADALEQRQPPFTMEQLQQGLAALITARDERLLREEAAWNLAYAEAFLAANREREGVHETASGLQYEVLRPGTGPSPTPEDTVRVHYHGMFADGTEFDSSYRRGVPSVFAVSDLIPGWAEALQLMPVGAMWRIYVPPGLAYGEQGAGPIGPNELLIFSIELLGIEGADS